MPFEPWTILLSIIAAFLVGIAKTGVPGLGLIAIPLMAFAFPAKESVGVLLLLLIVGDIFAVIYYRQFANIKILLKLVPWVALGAYFGKRLLGILSQKVFDGAVITFAGLAAIILIVN